MWRQLECGPTAFRAGQQGISMQSMLSSAAQIDKRILIRFHASNLHRRHPPRDPGAAGPPSRDRRRYRHHLRVIAQEELHIRTRAPCRTDLGSDRRDRCFEYQLWGLAILKIGKTDVPNGCSTCAAIPSIPARHQLDPRARQGRADPCR